MTTAASQPDKVKRLVSVGDSAFAEVACVLFEDDSPYEVSAFAVERPYLKRDCLLERPVVALDDLPRRYPPEDHHVFVAVVYTQMNRLRSRLVAEVRRLGYSLATYVSSRAYMASTATIGEHCFVFEGNNIQPFAKIGDDVILWSGNHIGHHSQVDDHVFISSHCVVSGFCTIGRHSFLGVNSSVANNVIVASDCWLGPGVVVGQDTSRGQLFKAATPEIAKVSTLRFFRVEDVGDGESS